MHMTSRALYDGYTSISGPLNAEVAWVVAAAWLTAIARASRK